MAMVIVDASCLKQAVLAAQVMWLGLRVGGRLALLYINNNNNTSICKAHNVSIRAESEAPMNRVNSRNDLVMMTAL